MSPSGAWRLLLRLPVSPPDPSRPGGALRRGVFLAALLMLSFATVLAGGAAAQEVSFSSGAYRVYEGDVLTPELVLSHARSEDVTVRVEALDLGSAASGDDFAAGPWQVTVPAGKTRQGFDIATFDDDVIESNEEFLLHVAPWGHSPGLRRSSDGDPDALAVITSETGIWLRRPGAVWEGETVRLEFSVSNPKSRAFNVDYTLSGGTASAADIAGGFGTRSVTVPANAKLVKFSVRTARDTVRDEGVETFSVQLSTSEPNVFFGHGTVDASVHDVDTPRTVTFESASSSVDEGAGTHHVTVKLLPGKVRYEGRLTLEYSHGPGRGTATPDADYVIKGSGGVTRSVVTGVTRGYWSAWVDSGATTVTIPVTIVDDGDAEGDETVVLRYDKFIEANHRGELTIRPGAPHSTHTLTIMDNDVGVSFASASQSVREGWGTRDVTVNLTSAPASELTVSYTVGGTATAGSDFTITNSGTLTVPAGARTATIPVALVDDGVDDAGETVVLTLAAGEGYDVLGPGTHTLHIDPVPTVRFAHRLGAAYEGGEWPAFRVPVRLQLSPPPAEGITLHYTVGPSGSPLSGTPTPGLDYEPLSGKVQVPAGAREAFIPVTVIDDSVEDSGEVMTLTLSDRPDYTVGSGGAHFRLYIFNHETGDLETLVQARLDAAVADGDGTSANLWRRALAAVRGEAPPDGLSPLTGAEAEALADGHAGRGEVELASLWAEIARVVGDGATDPPPEPGVTIAAGTSPVTEGGDAAFTLTAAPAPASALSVTVTVAGNGDYGITAGERTVTIPTTGSAVLTLPTTGDDADEPHGSVSVTVTDGSGYTVGNPASGSVTVRDDDAPAVSTPAIDPALVAQIRTLAGQTHHGTAHVNRWRRVLVAFGVEEYPGLTPTTAAEAEANAQKYSSPLWPQIATVLTKLEAAPEDGTPPDTPPVTPPEITVTADAASVTEGGDAAFTLTASPAPAAALPVSVTVATDGDYGIAAGTRTVTIPTTGSATLTLATTDDAADEPDGSVTVTVADGSGWTAGDPASGTVAIRDDDVPAVTLSADAASVTEGGNAVFTLTANPAPAADLPVSVSVAADGDYGISAGTQTVTIPTTGSATLTLPTTGDDADEPHGSATVTVQTGSGYTVGNPASGTVAIRDDDLPPPVVTIAAKAASVTEGGDAVFTLTADRAPDADLTVTLSVSETGEGDHVAAADEGPATLVIPKGATEAAFIVATVNDDADEPDGAAVVTVEAGAGYTVGDPASASVAVKDDDVPLTMPALSVGDSTAKEGGRLPIMPFTVRLAPAAQGPVRVYVSTRPSTPVSAEPGQDYAPGSSDLTFRAGETEKVVWIRIYDDSHDEGSETFEVVLSNAKGAVIGDGVAVGTIVNDDPMPAAFLARFGRTVAEQALDGIAGRMAAPRTAGMQGAIAGQAVGFGPTDSPGSGSGAGGTPAAGATPGAAPANGPGSRSGAGEAALAMADIARGFGNDAGGPGSGTGIGNGPGFMSPGSLSGTGGTGFGSWSGAGFGETPAHSRTMTARDALLGSSFSLTGEKDGSGGSMAFWGRAAQGSFDGREGTFSLDGTVTTGMLGADYARGRWLVGLALAQSDGEGDYRDTDIAARAASQDCPPEAAELCRGAVREGDGTVEASLTAAVPYAAFQASERLKLWGAAGYGTGEVTLKTELGGRYSADTSWSMAAAGLRGDLLQAPQEGSGPALAVTSDALWARTSSEKTARLAASKSDVTRLRVGLEGSYHVALEDGGSLVPKLELGARHDGGDAETGFGVELGGGVKWTDPGLGLSLDLSGRTLLAHGNDDLKDRGYAASLAYDPRPATQRGLSLSLRQDWGGQAQGGLDALFAPEPLGDRIGSGGDGEAESRWTAEAAYGLPVLGGRFIGSPHAGLGLAADARDWSLGWRLAPEAASAPDVSFGLRATLRESDGAGPEHTVGVEFSASW